MTATMLATIWQRLEEAATSRSAFNFLQLATIGLDGAPQVRTIVLRRCNPQEATLSFETDLRSPKVQEIRNDPRVTLVGFDPTASVQLRLSGEAAVVADDRMRRMVWQSLRNRTLVLFDTPYAPGTIIAEDGRDAAIQDTPSMSTSAFDRFALVSIVWSRLELLDLSPTSHIRHAFEQRGDRWVEYHLTP